MLGQGQKSWAAPALEQAVELAEGILPREFKDESELKGISKERFKKGQDGAGAGEDSALWPTPTASSGTGYMSGSNRDTWRPTLEGAAQMAPEGPPPKITAAEFRGKGRGAALKMWPTPRTANASSYPEDPTTYKKRRGDRSYETGTLANAANAACATEESRALWPTPTASGCRPSEGNMRILRKLVLSGDLPLEEAKVMLDGTSPFEAWGAAPKAKEKGGHKGLPAYTGPWPDHLKHLEGVGAAEEDKKMWPTPTTFQSDQYTEDQEQWESRPYNKDKKYEQAGLANAANAEEGRGMWLTPVASDSGGSRRETARKEHWKSNPGETLTDAAVKESWRTPTAREYKGASSKAWTDRKPSEGDATPSLTDQVNARQGRKPGRLNADWVEWLMGWPIGWTSLEPMDPDAYDYWEASIRKGPWWKSEPPDMVRIIKTQAKQGHRLKALGNGQVAMCAAAAFEALLETIWQVDQVIRRSDEEVDFLSLIGL